MFRDDLSAVDFGVLEVRAEFDHGSESLYSWCLDDSSIGVGELCIVFREVDWEFVFAAESVIINKWDFSAAGDSEDEYQDVF